VYPEHIKFVVLEGNSSVAEITDASVPAGKVIPIAIEDEVKTDYLTYAMSVIVSRALPDVRDGLKPVHRRILYAMDSLGLAPGAKTKKCALIIGETMGKYHPHGDMSIYDALVRMGQDFSLRYLLVEKQGNFGSLEDPPAAMRYTEAKISKIGDEMLVDLKKETVDFIPNYDASFNEPTVLPSAIPNLLINGSSGIAVGMATNMAPHNIVEICDAICAHIDNPELSVEDLMRYVQGPDFPTGAVIFGRRGIREAYKTGRGKLMIRGKFVIETTKSGKEKIVFTEIPYNVNKALVLEKIGQLMRDKVIDGIANANDESSDREGIRVVIELKKGAILKVVLNQLFSNTQLQTSFSIINLALVGGKPQCLNLKELIHYFIEHRVEVVTRRTRYDLRKAEERAHILEGLIIALANIDEVVAIIKASRDVATARLKLQERFLLSEAQSEAIVDMRLGRLTSLEIEKIQQELEELKVQIAYYKSLLADEKKLRGVIKDETRAIAQKFGDKRRTEIVAGEVENINIEDLIKKEEMMILISNLGYVKRVPVSAYRNQGRGGKGMQSAKLAEDDFIEQIFVASTHEYILFITSEGKAYWMKVHELPEGSRTSKGSHIKSLLTVTPNEDITAVVSLKDFSDTEFLFMGTARGVVKKVKTSEFAKAKTRGVIAINLDDGDKLVSALLTKGSDEVVLISRRGKALRTHEDHVRAMGRSSRGIAGIKLANGDELTGVLKADHGKNHLGENRSPEKIEKMLILSEYGFGKRVDFSEFSSHGRGTGGQKIYTVSDKTGEIIGCVSVLEDEDIMCITSQGKSIKLKVAEIRVMGPAAQGVRILSIDKPDFVIGLDRIVKEDQTIGEEE
jgi:DNA gyrase subunit A